MIDKIPNSWPPDGTIRAYVAGLYITPNEQGGYTGCVYIPVKPDATQRVGPWSEGPTVESVRRQLVERVEALIERVYLKRFRMIDLQREFFMPEDLK